MDIGKRIASIYCMIPIGGVIWKIILLTKTKTKIHDRMRTINPMIEWIGGRKIE